ncbi:MAG: class I SAM-dependent methyltransferase [Phycisphaerae bacterium]|nr:class I SAM-dependent methyltransferase [Phycisphaerae bacterium]
MASNRAKAKALAKEYIDRGRWKDFAEALYIQANGNPEIIPWADMVPNPHLVAWAEARGLREDLEGSGAVPLRALVIGCGLGDDAEYLAGHGFDVVAFDIAPTAIDWARERFPNSKVRYQVADLLDFPNDWRHAYDFVFEAYTLQSIPRDELPAAVTALADTVSPGGRLLIVCRGRDANQSAAEIPWPVCREDLAPLLDSGLAETSFEDYMDHETPPVRRFRAEYRRPTAR